MLKIECQEYLDEVKHFATFRGLSDKLQNQLEYLDSYGCRSDSHEAKCDDKNTCSRCRLFKDFAPASFAFTMEMKNAKGDYEHWFNGGLIFHGAHDGWGSGSAPTFSVTLEPTDGWSVHVNLGCRLCLPSRPGWVINSYNRPGSTHQWSPCPGCNQDAIEPVCTTCSLCISRRKEKEVSQ